MSVDTSNVRVAIDGGVFYGPAGTAFPTDADSAPDAAFLSVGAISEDGVKESRDRSTNDIKIWQNGAVARTVVTDAKITYEFTMVETTKRTQELFYGAPVTSDHMIVDPSSTGGRRAFIFDFIDGDKLKRVNAPQGEVTEVAEVDYDNSDATAYKVTVTCYYDGTLGGCVEFFWSDLPA